MILTKKECNQLFITLLAASIASSLLQTALATALPSIMRDLDISATTAQWLTSAYSLAMGIMIPATAFLMKRFPMRKLFLGAVFLFAIGTAVILLSNNFMFLLLGRLLQALGNGIILSATQVVILTVFPKKKQGTVMGIYGLSVGAAPVIAPTLSGIIIDIWNWKTIFLITLIIVFADILLSLKTMKNVTKTEMVTFDLSSMLLCTIGFKRKIICWLLL